MGKREWVGTRNRKKKYELGHVTPRCRGNAFNTDAFDQSEARWLQSAANQLVPSEDLKLDLDSLSQAASSAITTLLLVCEATFI